MSDDEQIATMRFESLRQSLHEAPSATNWRAIIQSTAHILASEDVRMVACFRAQYLPALRALIHTRYSPETRTTQINELIGTREFCATLVLDFTSYRMERYAGSLGLKHERGITKKMIDALLPHWCEGTHALTGLVLRGVDLHHAYLIDALSTSGAFQSLKYVRFEQLRDPRDAYTCTHIRAMMERLIALHGATLQALILSPDISSPQVNAAVYEPVMANFCELSSLRWLGFGSLPAAYHDGDDMLPRVLAEPGLEHVDTITLGQLDQARFDALTQRQASRHLTRLHISSMAHTSWHRKARRDLLAHPNLSNVTTWDMRLGIIPDAFVDQERARITLAEQRGETWQTLNHAVVDLQAHHPDQAHMVLFDGDTLQPSHELRALRVVHLSSRDITRILEGCAKAWPNLEALIFVGYHEDDGLIDVLEAVAWPKSLRFLAWGGMMYTESTLSRYMPHHAVPTRDPSDARLLSLVMDTARPAFLRYRVWHSLLSCIRNIKKLRALLKGLGLSGLSTLSKVELQARAESFILDYLDGPDGLFIDGDERLQSYDDRPLVWV